MLLEAAVWSNNAYPFVQLLFSASAFKIKMSPDSLYTYTYIYVFLNVLLMLKH